MDEDPSTRPGNGSVSSWRGRSQLGQVAVDGADGHRSLPDGAGDSLDRAVADVAGGEDPGQAGLER